MSAVLLLALSEVDDAPIPQPSVEPTIALAAAPAPPVVRSDIALRWDVAIGAADLALSEGDIATDEGLETAVIVSLFTRGRAQDGDELPAGPGTDRGGWWADDRIGSRLWLLSREKQLPAVLPRAEAYASEALAWLLEDLVASSVSVAASFPRPGWLALEVLITRPKSDQIAQFTFNATWDAQAAPRALVLGARVALVETEDGTVALAVNQKLQDGATSGQGTSVDTSGMAKDLTLFVVGSPGVTAGAVTPVEAHAADYTGEWWVTHPPIDVEAGKVVAVRLQPGCYRAIAARITTPVVGGTVDVYVMGN